MSMDLPDYKTLKVLLKTIEEQNMTIDEVKTLIKNIMNTVEFLSK